MKYLMIVATCGMLAGCGAKDEDTGSDTAVSGETTDTADVSE